MSLPKLVESVTRINFENHSEALMVKQCLEVDEELQPLKIERYFEVQDNVLIV